MNKIRYSEKKYLCDYDLSLEFFNELGIKVNDIVPIRNVFVIYTDEGNKILKKVNYTEDRVKLISDSLDYIKKNYENVITYSKLKNNLNYMKWKNDIYVIMDIFDGKEVSYSNQLEVNLCAENLALMHKASRGLREHLKNSYGKDVLDISLKDKYEKAYEEILWMKSLVLKYKYKNEFDELFLNNADNYLNEIKDVQEQLKKSKYEYLREKGDTISLCHNDLAYHNFLNKDNNIYILDFDFMTLDLRIMDIGDFILKSIKNAAFDIDKMLSCIYEYESISKLEREEIEVLSILMKFPKDFYTISRDYYFKRKKWEYAVYLNRFKTKLNNEIFRYDFLKSYKNKLLI